MTEPLRMSFDVACSAEHAFRVWTAGLGKWWPPDHTVTGRAELVALESGVGGRIYERTADGVEHEWGEVTVWQPPARLAYLWYLGRDRADATEVEIRFVARGAAATRIEIEHQGWDRLGSSGGHWRDRNRAGWQTLLPHFAAAIDQEATQRGQLMAAGTKDDPWELKTPPGTSSYTMYSDEQAEPPTLVCQVGSTTLKYQLRAIDDLHAWLAGQGGWVPLGAADEKKPAAEGTVEAWGRSPANPVGGWYGLRNGYRGRFGMYLPPLLEALGLAEVSHDPRNNRMRAI